MDEACPHVTPDDWVTLAFASSGMQTCCLVSGAVPGVGGDALRSAVLGCSEDDLALTGPDSAVPLSAHDPRRSLIMRSFQLHSKQVACK